MADVWSQFKDASPEGDAWSQFQDAPSSTSPTAQPTDKYAGMSVGQKLVNDIGEAGSFLLRKASFGAKTFNDTVARTALFPLDAVVGAANYATNSNVNIPGQEYQQWSDAATPPAKTKLEQLFGAAIGGLVGMKMPMPGSPAPKAPGTLQETFARGRNAGYVATPSNVNPTTANRVMETIVGKKELLADATTKNLKAAAKNVAEDLKLPVGTEINSGTVDAVIAREGEKYADIASLGGGYRDAIETIKQLRSTSQKYYRQAATNYSVEAEQKGLEAWNKAQAIDDMMGKALKSQGKPEMYTAYQEARKTIAKAYDVMKSLVKSSGELKAKSFAKDFGNGKPQSGALLDAGRTAEAFPAEFATKQSGPLHGLDNYLLGSGIGVDVLFHKPEWAAALIASGVGRGLARKALLSEPYQNMLMLTPQQKQYAIANAFTRSAVASNALQK